eukprot:m.9163 g.9163  ORF g.9163 m.9163 type:complete len:51 (+) comp9376_c0_seq3:455-607(+)
MTGQPIAGACGKSLSHYSRAVPLSMSQTETAVIIIMLVLSSTDSYACLFL